MTTTRIWYQPEGTTSATFDVPGAGDDPSKSVNLNGFTRQENNRYRFQYTANAAGQANVSMTNWPVSGNTSLSSYTFPGGGTIPASQNQVIINGRWELAWNNITNNSGTVRQSWTFQSRNNIGGNIDQTVDSITSPQVSPLTAYSPYAEYVITGAGVTGGSANTIQNVRFFANTSFGATKITGTGNPSGTWDVSTAFVYTVARRFEVNLHSATSSIGPVDSSVGRTYSTSTSTSYFEPGTETLVDYFDSDFVATGYVASEDIGGYTVDDYVGDETTTITVFGTEATLVKLASAAAESQLTFAATTAQITRSGQGVLTDDAELAAVPQLLLGTTISTTADTNLDAQAGFRQTATAAIAAETTLSEAVEVVKGLNAVLTETADAQATAENIIGISDGSGYIDTGYADADYFSAGQGLTIRQDSAVVADANIIRSDGSITFEAAFDAVIQPGFRIDAGVVAAGESEFEISPYTTAGTGILFRAAADLAAQAATIQAQSGLLLDNVVATAQLDSALQAISTTAILGTGTIALFDLELASDSESRPSIKVAIELADAGQLTATAFVDSSSRAELNLGSLELGPAVGGYRVGAELEITQEITSTWSDTQARIYYIDMYYTSVVARESRRYRTGPEARLFQPDSETRVNTNLDETRIFVVDPETRQADPAILPTTLRNSKLFRIPV
jgi:hypothetical protein